MNKDYVIHTILLMIVTFMIYTRDKYNKIVNDFTNPTFLSFFILLLLFAYWGLYIEHEDERISHATGRALSGFIIAYLAHADLMFVAFIVIWVFVFHTGSQWV